MGLAFDGPKRVELSHKSWATFPLEDRHCSFYSNIPGVNGRQKKFSHIVSLGNLVS